MHRVRDLTLVEVKEEEEEDRHFFFRKLTITLWISYFEILDLDFKAVKNFTPINKYFMYLK